MSGFHYPLGSPQAMKQEPPIDPPDEPREEPVHVSDCDKVHHRGGGYLHDEFDDSPYDVDGVLYCGRCHHCLP